MQWKRYAFSVYAACESVLSLEVLSVRSWSAQAAHVLHPPDAVGDDADLGGTMDDVPFHLRGRYLSAAPAKTMSIKDRVRQETLLFATTVGSIRRECGSDYTQLMARLEVRGVD